MKSSHVKLRWQPQYLLGFILINGGGGYFVFDSLMSLEYSCPRPLLSLPRGSRVSRFKFSVTHSRLANARLLMRGGAMSDIQIIVEGMLIQGSRAAPLQILGVVVSLFIARHQFYLVHP